MCLPLLSPGDGDEDAYPTFASLDSDARRAAQATLKALVLRLQEVPSASRDALGEHYWDYTGGVEDVADESKADEDHEAATDDSDEDDGGNADVDVHQSPGEVSGFRDRVDSSGSTSGSDEGGDESDESDDTDEPMEDDAAPAQAQGTDAVLNARKRCEEALKDAWASFRVDPEWVAGKAQTERDGRLTAKVVSDILQPTDYSPLQ